MWAVYRNTDMTEGKGSMALIAIFANYEEAYNFMLGIDPYGESVVTQIRELKAYGKPYTEHPDFDLEWYNRNCRRNQRNRDKESLIANAMAKLTLEERKALGLN